MAEDALLEETNRLLRRMAAIHDEQETERKQFKEKHEAEMAEWKSKADEHTREALRKQGLPEELVEGGEEEWEKRREEAMRLSKERVEVAKQKVEQYNLDVLQELRTQSELLRRIAEQLEP